MRVGKSNEGSSDKGAVRWRREVDKITFRGWNNGIDLGSANNQDIVVTEISWLGR
jgi:hypothetical protein